MTTLQHISPQRAAALIREGAVLIDIREADEHARARIPGAQHRPLSRLEATPVPEHSGVVIFHCRSGGRTQAHVARLAAAARCAAYALDGGLMAWQAAGLPVVRDRRQPIELIRQVQIAAGGLILLAVLLGALVAPAFYAVAGLIGAGLVFAGATGFCGMARLLARMPWNRRAASAA